MNARAPHTRLPQRRRTTATVAAATALGLLMTPLAPAVAASDDAPTTAAQASPAAADLDRATAQTPGIAWGFRQSFVSYVGGHHRLADGATESNREYTFPTTGTSRNGEAVTVTGRGLVQFAQYCTDAADTDTCQLDLTLSNPRVVLDPQGESAVYYTVRTRNYASHQVEGPQELKMATLDLTAAQQRAEAGVVSWTNVPTTLTAEGAHAFSDFYDAGTALAPLGLSYEGEPLEVEQGEYGIGESWNSGREVGDLHRVVELRGRVAHLTKSGWGGGDTRVTVLDPATMQPTGSVEVPGTATMASAADSASGRLYLADREHHAIVSYRLSDDGGLVREGIVPGGELGEDPFALGYDPGTGTLAVLALDQEGSGTIRFIRPDGTVEQHELPDPASVSPRLKDLGQEGLKTSEFYGSTYAINARVLEPLPDGSFLYSPGTSVYDTEDRPVMRGHLVQFSPGDEPVREVSDQIFPAADAGTDMRGLATSGSTVLRWNDGWNAYAADQVLRYEDGRFRVVKEAGLPADGASELSGMTMDGDRTVLVDTTHGRVLWQDPQQNVVARMPVPNLGKTAKNNPTVLKLSTGDIIVPTMIEDADYNENLYLQRLTARDGANTEEPMDPVPTAEPTEEPTSGPSGTPTDAPTPGEPTGEPSEEPGEQPTAEPSAEPTTDPSPSEAGPGSSAEATTVPTTSPDDGPTSLPRAEAARGDGGTTGSVPGQGAALGGSPESGSGQGSAEAGASGSSGALASTGARATGLVSAGLLAIGAGVLSLRAARRRRATR